MACTACGHDTRALAKYCEECGTPVPRIGGAPPPRAYTPRHLVERILTSRAALQGERKPVTVLFADVQGSMALAEQVDAEDWHAMMNQFFAILSEGVHRFEGTVNQYTGDGIMALFGAPLAHEDHAQRACYAALHLTASLREYAQMLRRERGVQFSVRLGLNSGEVVVGAIGDDLRMDYTAQGHTVGLAARMEQLCEPGRVYLTEHTAALVAGYVELEDLGRFTIKGVRAPLRVFALVGAGPLRTRLDVARARGLSRFIGRSDELARLDAACAAGRAAVIGIVAAAGVGKSRLCVELGERCRRRGAAVVETQAVAHGAALPWLPVLTLFRGLLGIGERDAPDTARQKIAGGLLLLDDRFKDSLPLLFDFLGAPDPARKAAPADPEGRLGCLVDACVALVRARAARQPVLLLIEDLHWLDAASETFLRRLVPALAEVALVVVLNFRPEYADDWLHGDRYERVALRPLGDAAVGELLDELLGRDASLGDLATRLRGRAAGNPFFLEELIQSLVQSGALQGAKGAYRLVRPVDDAAIPSSVQAVLAARIDRLAERDKDVLQHAAVIGKEFSEPVLRTVAGLAETELAASLRALAAAELVFEQAAFPIAEYAFKHPLTQEVAYSAQLSARRVQTHAAVARALIADLPATSAERAALIAYHWEKAGEMWEAARWQHRTARVLAGTDTREALARLRRVLALLKSGPESAESTTLMLDTYDDLLRVGTLVGLGLDDGMALFADARALAERTGNRAAVVRLLSNVSDFLMIAGQGSAAHTRLQEANALAGEIDDAAVQLNMAIDNAQTSFWSGHLRAALAHSEEALQRLQHGAPVGGGIPVGLTGDAFVIALRGLCRSLMGRVCDGAADLERAMQLADESGSLEGRCIARLFRSMAAHLSGEAATGVPLSHAAVELATRAGNPFLERMVRSNLGAAHVSAGRYDEAIRTLAPLVENDATDVVDWFLFPTLAEAYRLQGDFERAAATARRGVEVARASGALTAECHAQLSLVRACAAGEPAARETMEQALARADHLIDESGAVSFRPRWHLARADSARAVGDPNGARDELRKAQALCETMGMGELADQVARELAAAGGAEEGG
jgi:class 3 adenylate cyclase/tetratricopeptide (TPR) repeat protein